MVRRGEQLPAFVDGEALLALTTCLLLPVSCTTDGVSLAF